MQWVEITKKCPLCCPGCYAYEPRRIGDAGPLRILGNFQGQALNDGDLALVGSHQPIYGPVDGGEAPVRFRELDTLVPRLSGA
jgi:hypothetical protein